MNDRTCKSSTCRVSHRFDRRRRTHSSIVDKRDRSLRSDSYLDDADDSDDFVELNKRIWTRGVVD